MLFWLPVSIWAVDSQGVVLQNSCITAPEPTWTSSIWALSKRNVLIRIPKYRGSVSSYSAAKTLHFLSWCGSALLFVATSPLKSRQVYGFMCLILIVPVALATGKQLRRNLSTEPEASSVKSLSFSVLAHCGEQWSIRTGFTSYLH